MIGSLVFLGCPWRALLRLAGGDLNAIIGLIGLVAGIGIGVFFIKSGFNLGRSSKTNTFTGLLFPLTMVAFLLLLIFHPKLPSGALFFSENGPGAQHAPIIISLIVAIVIGFLAQRTRFCTMGAFRDLLLIGDTHLISGVIALVIGALITNVIFKQFNRRHHRATHCSQQSSMEFRRHGPVRISLCPGRRMPRATVIHVRRGRRRCGRICIGYDRWGGHCP